MLAFLVIVAVVCAVVCVRERRDIVRASGAGMMTLIFALLAMMCSAGVFG